MLHMSPEANLSDGSHFLAPDDFATIYNISPVYGAGIDGTGQKIAIVGTSAILLDDIRTFRKNYNLPAADPKVVVVGRDPGVTASFGEAYFDVEWAGAVARNAAITYIYASSVTTAAAYAVDMNVAPILSMSFGGCEAYNSQNFRAVAQQANAQGITFLAASGDTGAASCDVTAVTPQASKGKAVVYPASLPEVTAIGGTTFDEGSGRYWSSSNNANGASALGYIPEKVWNDSVADNWLEGGGGGVSTMFAKPWWQSAPGVPDDKMRDLPDIAMTASWLHDGYGMFVLGSYYSVGGTSAPTPAFAGVVALLNQALTMKGTIAQAGLGNINPALYRMARGTSDVFHDITTGDNAVPCVQESPDCVDGTVGYKAAVGYDLATGLGSVDVARMIAQWTVGAATTTPLTSDTPAPRVSDTVTLTAKVATQGGGTPAGTVTFVTQIASDSTLGSATLDSSGSATLQVSGRALLASSGTVTALYIGDATHEASSGTWKADASNAGAHVVAYVWPNPSAAISVSGWFPVVIVLYERSGVPTTITSFKVSGITQPLTIFSSTSIPANGSISFSGSYTIAATRTSGVFDFAGSDADGTTWSDEVTIQFARPAGPQPRVGIQVISSADTVTPNPAADPSCRWSHLLTVHETGGFFTQLTALAQGNTSLTANIQKLFGTTRLAPFGSLTATLCLNDSASPGSRIYTLSGLTEAGYSVSATAPVNFVSSAASGSAFTASPTAMSLDGETASSVSIDFGGDAAAWTAVLPASPSWLTLSTASGTGAARLTLQAKTSALSKGAYTTLLWIQCATCQPQTVQIPVTVVVGLSSAVSITGLANGASLKPVFAPGMVLSVFGAQLAPATGVAGFLPLPLTLNGVSATVNGVAAPLYFVSAGQINLQVPYETGIGTAVLAINNNGKLATSTFTAAAQAPGVFTASDGGLAPNVSGMQGQTLLAFITGDGDLAPTLATGATPASSISVSNLPKPRLPVTMKVGGVDAKILFVGVPPGLAGVTQINFTVPTDAPVGDQPVVITVGGVDSPPAKLTITAAQ
jgi:uncharacterized protein (TIGR03437 family)